MTTDQTATARAEIDHVGDFARMLDSFANVVATFSGQDDYPQTMTADEYVDKFGKLRAGLIDAYTARLTKTASPRAECKSEVTANLDVVREGLEELGIINPLQQSKITRIVLSALSFPNVAALDSAESDGSGT